MYKSLIENWKSFSCEKMKFIAIFLVAFLAVNAERARFDDYRVYSITIENDDQFKIMKYIEEHSDAVKLIKIFSGSIFYLI